VSLLAVLFFLAQQQLSQTIIVTASELPETLESTPASVTVFTRNDIDLREARDVADVLREVPGLHLARSGSAGKATSLFSRGAASTQTLVLWNGIEMNNPYFSGYDWGRFSTAGVEQVEIVRGPFSALYGSDAMGGVINVLTTPHTSGVRAEVQGGGRGLRNGTIDGAYVSGPLAISGTADLRRDDGFNPNDDFRQDTYYVAGKWKWFGLTARATSYDLGIPFNTSADATMLVPSPDRRQDGHEWEIALPVSYRWFNLTLSQNKRTDNFSDPNDPFTTATRTDSTSRRGRVTGHFGTFVAGAEYERVIVSDFTNLGPNFEDQHRTDRALFVEDRLSHAFGSSRLEVSLGLRNDRFDIFGSQTSPRVAAAWIRGEQKYRIAYGEGFRAPSLGELYYPFFGNPNLKAEQNRSLEAGFDWRLFNVTYFRAKYRDLITFDPSTFSIAYGGTVVAAHGVNVDHDTDAVAAHLARRHLRITADLGLGDGHAFVLTNDLTHGYIDENRGTS